MTEHPTGLVGTTIYQVNSYRFYSEWQIKKAQVEELHIERETPLRWYYSPGRNDFVLKSKIGPGGLYPGDCWYTSKAEALKAKHEELTKDLRGHEYQADNTRQALAWVEAQQEEI